MQADDAAHPEFDVRQRLFVGLAAVFVTSWLIGDLTGGKYFLAFGRELSVGMITFPLTFVLTDIIHEFYGPKGARLVTFVAAGMAAYVFFLLQLLIALPTAPTSVVSDEVFVGAFGQSVRLFAASLTAFLIGQLIDVKVFHAIRARTGKRHVWLRANASTAISQLVDTVVINTAFLAGQRPARFIVGVIGLSYAYKLVAAALLTPLLYFLHGVVERRLAAGEAHVGLPRSAVFARTAGFVAIAGLLYLFAYPTGMQPIAYQPHPFARFEGPYAPTEAAVPTRLHGDWFGPEAIVFDEDGRMFAGLADGRIVMRGRRGKARDIVSTNGRPLGMASLGGRRLAVADARRGLLLVDTERRFSRVIVDEFMGQRMRFVDDVARLPDGRLVFTDASQHFGIDHWVRDLLDQRPSGRVFLVDPRSREVRLLARDLQFANGVAVSVDGSYALVCETGRAQLHRIELADATLGNRSTIGLPLPGYCDNIRRDPDRDVFWVALPAPRDARLEGMAARPFLRTLVGRLPDVLRPGPSGDTMFVAVNGSGQPLLTVRRTGEGAYGPVTSVVPQGDQLWLGSLSARGVARLPRPPFSASP